MPIISSFYGIIIYMFWRDHNPPHFHARYGEYEIIVEIETGRVEGTFPKRALQMIQEWRQLHKPELLENWTNAVQNKPIKKIKPLE
ncbi:MAG: DUF4160 domain-containing protein [Nitrospirae bacterium]|nr:MAG: DUF4160 domain-containing protein [Nitrospirota bacterium]